LLLLLGGGGGGGGSGGLSLLLLHAFLLQLLRSSHPTPEYQAPQMADRLVEVGEALATAGWSLVRLFLRLHFLIALLLCREVLAALLPRLFLSPSSRRVFFAASLGRLLMASCTWLSLASLVQKVSYSAASPELDSPYVVHSASADGVSHITPTQEIIRSFAVRSGRGPSCCASRNSPPCFL